MTRVLSSVFMSLVLAVSSAWADAAAFDGTVEDWPTSTSIAIGTNLVLKTTTSSTEAWSFATDKPGYLDVKVETNADNTATFTLTPLYAYGDWPLTVKHGSTELKTFSIDIPAEEHTLVLQAGETFTTNVTFFKATTWSVTGGKYVTATSSASGAAQSTMLTIQAGEYSVSEDVMLARTNSQGAETSMHVYHVTVTGGEEPPVPPPPAPEFTVTPYVQRPATNAMTVLFFTTDDCAATVRCWPAEAVGGVVTQTVETTCAEAQDLGVKNATDDVLRWAKQYRHRVRFEGLEPGTRYAYEVRLGTEGPVYANFFRTVPDRDTPVRFVAYSDSETIPPTYRDTDRADANGCTTQWEVKGRSGTVPYYVSRSEGFASNLVHMAAWKPDLYVIAGDLVARGGVQMFWDEFWRENAGGLGLGYNDPAGSVPILAVTGNHDLYDNVGASALSYDCGSQSEKALAKYLNYFEFNSNGVDYASAAAGREQDSRDKSQLFHREDYGSVTLLFVDTNSGLSSGARTPDFSQGSLQYRWLEANLKDARDVRKSRFTFVVNHHCPYSRGKHNSEAVRAQLTPLLMKYGVTGWLCGHEEMQEHAQVVGEAELADGSKRPHVLNVYDLGSAGDGLKGAPVVDCTNVVFAAYSDSPDGTHYGHLRVEAAPSNDVWQCTLTPVYSYVTSSHSSELRAYKDKIIINEDGTIAYEERLEPETEANVTIDSIYATRSHVVATTGKAGAWSCEVSDERYLSAAVTRKFDGSATVTVNGLAETTEEQVVRVYASLGTAEEPMLVKVITVRAVVALPPEPQPEDDIAVLIDAGLSSNVVTTTTADSWSCKVPSGMSSHVTATATRQADGTAKISISTANACGSPIAVEVYAHSDAYAKDYLVKTISVTVRDPPAEPDPEPSPDDADETIVLAPGATTNLVTASVATYWNCTVSSSQATATVTRQPDGTSQLTLKGASSLAEGSLAANVVTVGLYRGSSIAGYGTLLKTVTVKLGEAITLVRGGEPVTRSQTYSSERWWAVCRDADAACVTAALNVATEAYDKYGYSLRTTGKAKSVTLTLTGTSVGEASVGLARHYSDDESPKLMGIYYVTVVAGEPTPYELLRAAFESGAGTYALETDVECPAGESLTLAAGKSFVLDLNGHSLTCHRDGAIVNAGDLTIADSTASDPFDAHVAFSEDELSAGYALVCNRAGATLTVDGVYVDAGYISDDDYEFACANTAVSAEGGTVIVTNGGHLGGLCGIEAKGDCTITVEGDASVCGTSWRGTGGRQLSTAVLFASGTSVLTVRNATLDSEGWLVRSQTGSAATVSVTGSILRSERASAPFDLAAGTSVSLVGSSYADLSKIPTVTALANAGADLTVGLGCTLVVSEEGVIGFLDEGVGVEATGTRTWRTVVRAAGEWAEISEKLGAATEFTQEPKISVAAMDVQLSAEGQELTVCVAVSDGEDIRQVDPSKVASFVEATSDLSDWTANKLDLTVKSAVRNDDNTIDITLASEASLPAAFIRINVR